MEFKPNYSKIVKENKDIVFNVHHYRDSTISFIYTYNSISNTYMGVMVDCFIDTMRGFLRVYPDFFENISEYEFEKDIQKLGFVEVAPSEVELLITK
jgi:hypothetical protein